MSNKYILDKDGNPVPCEDVIVWAEWMQRNGTQIALDEDANYRISTIFLGLNYGVIEGFPILFETMVFDQKTGKDEYCLRFSSRVGALQGHERAMQEFGVKRKVELTHENLVHDPKPRKIKL